MTNPTTPFSWQMPTASDLVTDLPADFETFGQAVATSMADLLGGTTGQILAKASNTDMDFTWVANDVGDITAVTAGTGITGGGTSGAVTVSFDQANFGGGQFAAGKNKIINGDFNTWQRGTSFSAISSSQYTSDRWLFQNNGTGTATISRQNFTPGAAPIAGYEYPYFYQMATNSVGTSTVFDAVQRIEDVTTFAGQTVTLSFFAKADSTRTIDPFFGQNFGSGGSSGNNTFGTSITLTTSWARYSQTFTLPSISGKTIGTSSFLTVALRTTPAASAVISIFGVQVEAGSTATPFQTATGTIQGELAACQRYYYRATTGNPIQTQSTFGLGACYLTTAVQVYMEFPVTMRTNVSATADYASLKIQDINTGALSTPSAVTYNSITTTAAQVLFTGMSALTVYRPYAIVSDGVNTAYIAFSAEL